MEDPENLDLDALLRIDEELVGEIRTRFRGDAKEGGLLIDFLTVRPAVSSRPVGWLVVVAQLVVSGPPKTDWIRTAQSQPDTTTLLSVRPVQTCEASR